METRPSHPLGVQRKLLEAAIHGQVDVMKALLRNLELKVDYDYLDLACRTPSPNSDQIVKLLLEKVKPKVIRPELIHYAAEHGNHLALRELLRHKTCRVNAEDSDGRTALHLAANNFKKNPDNYSICLELLLECPTIDINHLDMYRRTAIMEAALFGGREALVKMLELRPTGFDLERLLETETTERKLILYYFPDLKQILPPVRVVTSDSSAPQAQLLEATLNDKLQVFKFLLQQVDHDGTPFLDPNHSYGKPYLTTCIEEACSYKKHIQYLEALLRANANPNLVNVFSRKAPIHVAIACMNLPAVNLLLQQATLNVNISDDEGDTPLHYVVRDVDDEQQAEYLVRQLLEKGADVVVKNEQGKTAIMEAAIRKKKQLLKCMLPETDIDEEIKEGVTLKSFVETHFPELGDVNVATQNTDIRNRLKKKLFLMLYGENCDGFVKDLENFEMTATEMKVLLNEDDGKSTFMQTACSLKNSNNVVQVLLEKGVDPNLTITQSSSPPLVMAAEKKNYDAMKVLLDVARDKLYVNKGDKKGRTALHVVVKNRNLEMVMMLLNAGARMDIKDNLGKEPISTAAMKDLMDMSTYDDEYRIKLCFGLFIQNLLPQQNQLNHRRLP